MYQEISSFLIRSPNVCGGRLRIDGTRITVAQIALWYRHGYNPEEITELYPHLTPAQVYTALAYYHANRKAVETELLAEEKDADVLERQYMKAGSICYAD